MLADNKDLPSQLPLRWQTPPSWAASALSDPLALLNDHAHLEKKAAVNALDLLLLWPAPDPPEHWVAAMTSIANDEVAHLQTVTRLLARRGGELSRLHMNPYAAELRKALRRGQGVGEVIDRLLVSALIEARSCERFHLLASHAQDVELARLYNGLYASEAGHYKVFLSLARSLKSRHDVEARWEDLLEYEADVIQRQEPGPTMHSGVPV